MSTQGYPFAQPLVSLTGVVTANYTGATPGVQFVGTETSGQTTEIREIAGVLWLVQNATYNGTNWTQTNALQGSSALRLSQGQMDRTYVPAGTAGNIVWPAPVFTAANSGTVTGTFASGVSGSAITSFSTWGTSAGTALAGTGTELVASVPRALWGLGQQVGPTITQLLAVDGSGNVGAAGVVKAVGGFTVPGTGTDGLNLLNYPTRLGYASITAQGANYVSAVAGTILSVIAAPSATGGQTAGVTRSLLTLDSNGNLAAFAQINAGSGFQVTGVGSNATITTSANFPAALQFPSMATQTYIGSQSTYAAAGIFGVVAVIGSTGGAGAATKLTIDNSGNVGITGALTSGSSIKLKKDVAAHALDPMGILAQTEIVRFRYKEEDANGPLHYGFIAEHTPEELSGPGRDRVEPTSFTAVLWAAVQEMNARLVAAEAKIATYEGRA